LSGIRAAAILAAGVSTAALTRDVTATLAAEALVTLAVTGPSLFGARGRQLLHRAASAWADFRRLSQFYPAAARLLWLNGTTVVLYAVDRWFGIALLTKHDYGIFALGLTIVLLFETMQTIVNVSAFPLMGRMLARGEHRRAFRFATTATIVVLTISAMCYLPFLLLVDYLLNRYLPSYLEAEVVIKLAVIAGAFRLGDFYSSFAVLLDQERRLAIGSGILLALSAAGLAAAAAMKISFDPDRMMAITVVIATGAFALNLAIATRAYLASGGNPGKRRHPDV
jgi:O-antigen/teichoic acid export membrane protein